MITTVVENGKTYANIDDLHEWEQNNDLRVVGPDAFRRLKEQITELGEYKPILITEDGTVLGGNTRLRAFRELGYARLWVSLVPITDQNQLLKYNLSDNDNVGLYNENGLANLLSDYEINLDNYAVDFQEPITLSDLLPKEGEQDVVEDEAPEVSSEPAVSQLGEIYQLGRHRLMCGDSTSVDAVEKLLGGRVVSMVFTDPPYNAAFNGRSGNHEVILNDKLGTEEFKQFLTSAINTLYAIAPQAPLYICTDWKMYPLLYTLMQKPSACIVWVKNMFGMGNGYRHQHELIVFEGALEANDQSDVWEIKRDNGADYDHPTQKPVAIPARAIKNSSKADGVVLDTFGGSGPTLIACEQMDRTACVMELDPKYCDVIRKRYAKFTNQDDWQSATPQTTQ